MGQPLSTEVIVASTRQGRLGPTVAAWFVDQARRRDDLAVDVIDLVEVDLPRRLGEADTDSLRAYRKRLDAADAFVVVTPEYNHGYPASIKQAVDVARQEWVAKPLALVSYGGLSGGIRAAEQLRQVFAEMHTVTMRTTVAIPFVRNAFDADGRPVDPARISSAATKTLDELVWWGRALRTARAGDPYPG